MAGVSGQPLRSSGSSLRWTAPSVGTPQPVTIAITLASPDGCSRTETVNLVVLPRSLAGIRLEKGCRFQAPARIGDGVLYTYNVTNSGDLPLFDINLTDAQNWGPGCLPVYMSGDDGDGILDPGESWLYECRYTIADPDDYQRLQIMESSGSAADVVNRLLDMKARLEIMMERLRQMEALFDLKSATLNVSRELLFTSYNYSNDVTGESCSRIMDGLGRLNRTVYFDPVTGAMLTRQHAASGKMIFEEVYYPPPGSREYLKIEYDLPAAGYRTYTVIDYKSGDTLILVVDARGNILKKEYRITPGYRPYEKRYFLKNTATVTARTEKGDQVEDYDSFTLEVLRPMPVLAVVKVPEKAILSSNEILNYTITYQNIGQADASDVVVMEFYDKMQSFLWSDPPPDPGSTEMWTVKDLRAGESGSIRVGTRVSSDAAPGSQIVNRVEAVLKDTRAVSVVNTTVAAHPLNISKRASREAIGPEEAFVYTIEYSNNGEYVQHNVTIHDWLDPNVDFTGYKATPPLIFSSSGGHLLWQCGDLSPGAYGSIEIEVQARSSDGIAESVFNRYRIDSSLGEGAVRTLETPIAEFLWINKTADKNRITLMKI